MPRVLRAAGAAFTALGQVIGGAFHNLTLFPQYLAGLLWLIETKFLALARQGYGANAAVYSCLRLLSQSVPEPPLLAYQVGADGTEVPLDRDHPLMRLIARPNELQTEYEFWELTTLFLGVTGIAHWWKERDNAGRLLALWPLRPDRIGPIYSESDQAGQRVLSGWSYLVPGTVHYVPLARADVLTFNFPDPAGESGGLVEGLGPLQVLAAEVSADNEATKFVGSMVANYGQPGVVITTKTPVRTADDAKLIKAAFIREFGGARRGMPAVLDADSAITTVGFNLRDLEFRELRNVAEARISAAFGVPAVMVGLNTGIRASTRMTLAEYREYFAETTCANYWRRYSDQYTNDVAPEFGERIVCRFDMTRVKALAEQSKYDTQKVAEGFAGGAVTINEYRTKVLMLPPLIDGDVRVVPTTVTEIPAGAVQTVENVGKSVRIVALRAALAATDEHRSAVRRGRDQRTEDGVATFSPRIHAILGRMADAIIAKLPALTAATKADDGDLIDPDLSDELDAAVADAHKAALAGAYADTSALLAVGISFDLANPRVKDVLNRLARGRYYARDGFSLDETTRDVVRQLIDQGTSAGWSIDTLAAKLRDASAFGWSRAITVARTETGLAYNLGSLLAYHDSGVVGKVQVLDGIHDGPCADANGAIWTLQEAAANPLQHARCVRAFAPLVGDVGKEEAA